MSMCKMLVVFIPVGNLLKYSTLSFGGSVWPCNLEALKYLSNNTAIIFLVLVYNPNWYEESNLIPFFSWNICAYVNIGTDLYGLHTFCNNR